jgi:hypothetical protein
MQASCTRIGPSCYVAQSRTVDASRKLSDMLQTIAGKRRNQLHSTIHWPKGQYCSLATIGFRSAFRISTGLQMASAVAMTVVQYVW